VSPTGLRPTPIGQGRRRDSGAPVGIMFLMYATSTLTLYIRNTLQHGTEAKRRIGGWRSDPMRQASGPSTWVLQVRLA